MQILEFYKAGHTADFKAAAVAVSVEPQTLRILFAASFISGLQPMLKMCRQWVPTASSASAYTRVECTELMFTEDSFVADLALLHTGNILVRSHGYLRLICLTILLSV